MSSMKRNSLLVVLAACVLVLTVAAQAQLREEFHQTLMLESGGKVSLHNLNGSVKIAGWDKSDLQIDAVKSADTQANLDGMRIEVSKGGSSVEIRTKWDCCFHNGRAAVDYTIHVPRKAALQEISVVNGGVEIAEIEGIVNASSVNGSVHVSKVSGELKLKSVNGSIDAELTNLAGEPVSMKSVNGSLHLRLPASPNATIAAKTVNGSINNGFSLPVERHHCRMGANYEVYGCGVGMSMDGRLGNGASRMDLKTVNGGIQVAKM